MKKINYLFILFIAVLATSCGPTQDDVINANDKFVDGIDICSKAEKEFFDVCDTYDSAKIDSQLKLFVADCEKAKKQIDAIKVHKDIDNLKASALKLTDTYLATKGNYAEYARLYSIAPENFTEENEKETKAVSEKINKAIDGVFADFTATQDEYSKKYNFSFEKKNKININ